MRHTKNFHAVLPCWLLPVVNDFFKCIVWISLVVVCWVFFYLCSSGILASSSLFFGCVFIWFWYYSNAGLIKWIRKIFSLFSSVPVAVSNFPPSLQLLLGRGAFPVFSPPSLSSLHMQKHYPALHASLSSRSPLHAMYLLSSVVQVVQVVVLILRSIF